MRDLSGLTIGALVLASIACSKPPTDYGDCILQNVDPEMNQQAVLLIAAACREKFPERRLNLPDERPLETVPRKVVTQLAGRFGPSHGNQWKGNFHNGSAQWLIREITIRVTEPGWTPKYNFPVEPEEGVDEREYRDELYAVDIYLPPLSSRDFSLTVHWRPDDDFQWSVVTARGWRVQ